MGSHRIAGTLSELDATESVRLSMLKARLRRKTARLDMDCHESIKTVRVPQIIMTSRGSEVDGSFFARAVRLSSICRSSNVV